MTESTIFEDNPLMNIESDYYQTIFDGRLCPSQKDLERKKRKGHPFEHMWELFVYAAILGISRDKREPIEKAHKPFRWLNIGQAHQRNLLILTIAKYDSFDIINNKEELKKAIEEYANGGIMLIDQEIKNDPSAYSGPENLVYRILQELEPEAIV